jgi:hypothetical protein
MGDTRAVFYQSYPLHLITSPFEANGATGGVEPAPATKNRPGWERRVECLLLEIALGSRDVTYYFILLSIVPSSTTVAPVSFPGTVRYIVHRHPWYVRACEKLKRRRLDELCPRRCCCRSSVAATEAFRLSLTSFARLIDCGTSRDSKGKR